jgi:selenocysteine lyase/cysteine desulfurase
MRRTTVQSEPWKDVMIASYGDVKTIQQTLRAVGYEVPADHILTPQHFGQNANTDMHDQKKAMMGVLKQKHPNAALILVDDRRENVATSINAGHGGVVVNPGNGINIGTVAQIYTQAVGNPRDTILVLDFDNTLTTQHVSGQQMKAPWTYLVDSRLLFFVLPAAWYRDNRA